jgi:hypothetical protein
MEREALKLAQEPYCYVDPVYLAVLNTHQSALVTLQKNPSGYASRGLYTTPPKREWVGLTPEETSGFTQHEMTVVKYVSKVLQEKNT